MRTNLRIFLVVLAVIAVGVLTLHLTMGAAGDVPGDNLVTAAAAETLVPTTTEPVTTTEAPTTTVDPAALAAFYDSLTTTTTAPPPPPTTARPTTTTAPAPPTTARPAPPSGGGGGCVIPAYICQRESGMSYTALNPSSGAGGMYQFLPSTWNGIARAIAPEWVGTPPHTAPPSVQDRFAAYLWAGGAGCSHWSAC